MFSRHRLFLDSIGAFLAGQAALRIVLSSSEIERLPKDLVRTSAEALLYDCGNTSDMREASALVEACADVPLVALGIAETPENVIACADAGIAGYLAMHAPISELEPAVRRAVNGECACNPRVTALLFRELRRRRTPEGAGERAERLTPREADVLALLARGLSNKQIASELSLSVATIKNHLHHVFSKLDVDGRATALVRVRNEPWLVRSG